jgi:hypothetical protein
MQQEANRMARQCRYYLAVETAHDPTGAAMQRRILATRYVFCQRQSERPDIVAVLMRPAALGIVCQVNIEKLRHIRRRGR